MPKRRAESSNGLLGSSPRLPPPLSLLQGDDNGIFIVDGVLSFDVDDVEYKPISGTTRVSLLLFESWLRGRWMGG